MLHTPAISIMVQCSQAGSADKPGGAPERVRGTGRIDMPAPRLERSLNGTDRIKGQVGEGEMMMSRLGRVAGLAVMALPLMAFTSGNVECIATSKIRTEAWRRRRGETVEI